MTFGLPWKETHPQLPDNLEFSCRRLENLFSQLWRNPDLLSEYDSVIQNKLCQGIVAIVKELFSDITKRIHYHPHHAVIRRDKQTTKLQVVYNASARSGDGPSLNNCLHVYAGPPIGQKIFNILLWF